MKTGRKVFILLDKEGRIVSIWGNLKKMCQHIEENGDYISYSSITKGVRVVRTKTTGDDAITYQVTSKNGIEYQIYIGIMQ